MPKMEDLSQLRREGLLVLWKRKSGQYAEMAEMFYCINRLTSSVAYKRGREFLMSEIFGWTGCALDKISVRRESLHNTKWTHVYKLSNPKDNARNKRHQW